ncbi:divergent paired-related homeobox [Tupaia chinensis]|uniref:divergent paired-related homeobox n=1 Tax=Tupaia chinensis TaxID=246437 RepID=UPI000FFC2FA8|nr:divergent paired-related homeobox [Tupaia chinensis]
MPGPEGAPTGKRRAGVGGEHGKSLRAGSGDAGREAALRRPSFIHEECDVPGRCHRCHRRESPNPEGGRFGGLDPKPSSCTHQNSQRRRTIFTEKQLEDLNFLFSKNPYPHPSLQKEMALKMDLHPTVLQVWFKNHRAKLKRARLKFAQQHPDTPQHPDAQREQLLGGGVKTRASQRDMDPAPGSPDHACPAPLVYTDSRTPSFQLSVCSNIRAPADPSAGHKIVHFGCCRDPNIYCLSPILEPLVRSRSLSPRS